MGFGGCPPTCKRGPFVRCHALLATIESARFGTLCRSLKFMIAGFRPVALCKSCSIYAQNGHIFPEKWAHDFTHIRAALPRPRAGLGSVCPYALFQISGDAKKKNKARIPPGCETVLIKITRPLPSAAPGFSDRLYSLCAAIFSASSNARFKTGSACTRSHV